MSVYYLNGENWKDIVCDKLSGKVMFHGNVRGYTTTLSKYKLDNSYKFIVNGLCIFDDVEVNDKEFNSLNDLFNSLIKQQKIIDKNKRKVNELEIIKIMKDIS